MPRRLRLQSGLLLQLAIPLCCLIAAVAEADEVLYDFKARGLPDEGVAHNATVTHVAGRILEVAFELAEWPQVYFQGPSGGWDWSAYGGLLVATMFLRRVGSTTC